MPATTWRKGNWLTFKKNVRQLDQQIAEKEPLSEESGSARNAIAPIPPLASKRDINTGSATYGMATKLPRFGCAGRRSATAGPRVPINNAPSGLAKRNVRMIKLRTLRAVSGFLVQIGRRQAAMTSASMLCTCSLPSAGKAQVFNWERFCFCLALDILASAALASRKSKAASRKVRIISLGGLSAKCGSRPATRADLTFPAFSRASASPTARRLPRPISRRVPLC